MIFNLKKMKKKKFILQICKKETSLILFLFCVNFF